MFGIGVGDNRGTSATGGTYRVRGDIRIDPGSNGNIYSNTDVAKSSVFFEGLGRRGTGGVGLAAAPTTDLDGTRHFTVSGEGTNGFSGLGGPSGDISFQVQFSVSPLGDVTVDSVTGRTFPSLEIYSYQPGQDPQLLLSFGENKESDLTKPQQQIYPPRSNTVCIPATDANGKTSQYCSSR